MKNTNIMAMDLLVPSLNMTLVEYMWDVLGSFNQINYKTYYINHHC